MTRFPLLLALAVGCSACGGSSNSPTTPTRTATGTKVIALSGSLAFGDVEIGKTSDRNLAIANSGTATLTVTGMTGPSGYTASWTTGTIPPGGNQQVTVRFTPTAAQNYNGTLTVNADHTSGTNTIAVSGTGVSTPTATPPTGTLYTVTGTVTESGGGPLPSATILVRDGPDERKTTTTNASGAYTLSGLQAATFRLRASKDGYSDLDRTITLPGTTQVNFALQRSSTPPAPTPGPGAVTFGPGQHRVNVDIKPGRYFSDPAAGCYWERQSGFGGTLSDIIANEFIGFDAGQWIVDIASSDVGFEADADCGTWFNTPRRGAQASIPPGMWLVGAQITAGTYNAATRPGCYWERLRNFSGTVDGIIANDFVADGGSRLVSISGSDAGFSTDDDCGQWTRTSAVTTFSSSDEPPVVRAQSIAEKERNRTMQRRQSGAPIHRFK